MKGITKGKWVIDNDYGIMGGIFINDDDGRLIAKAESFVEPLKEREANAILIADAGTTANKCQLLPSELLVQRDELLEALQRVDKAIDDMKLNNRFGHTQMYVKEAIKNAKGL